MAETKQCSKCKESIDATAKRCKHCQADLRNWFVRHKIMTAGLVLLLLIIVAAAGGDDSDSSSSSSSSSSTSTSSDSSSDSKDEEEEEAEAEVEKKFKPVITFSAQENKQSETFALEGGQQNLKYTTTGGEYAYCTVYLMKEGTTLDEDGGFPEVSIDGTKSDETLLRKSAGDYYFDIQTVNGSCEVELQELR
jgi:hypothetical protein